MIHLFLFFAHVFLLVVAGSELSAPGAQDCPPLQVGHRVVAEHSCTHASSPEGTVCSFSCHKGFKLDGPEVKHCQMDGTWTDADAAVVCNDINECDTMNGFCSHICKNTPGGYECACPDPFYLDPTDQRTCKAHGVSLTCDPNHMKIVLPKNLVEHDLGHEHLSLLDESDQKCRANSNATHYILATANTECGTTSHLYKNFVVYTNRVIESPNDDSDVITTVGKNEIKVPFSCYYNDLEIVHTVGFKPVAQKIHVYVKGRGEYALSLDIFKNSGYGESRLAAPSSPKYTEDDFPISVHLRERVYVQASLDTRETDLKIFASNCCTTPMRDHEATIKFRHALIVEGCPKDPSVQFHHTSDPTKIRFSFKAFQFLGNHDYVFVHCRVHVCDANDANSRCAQGCAATPIPVHDIGKQSEKLQPAKKQDKKPLVQPKELAKKLVAQLHPDQDSKGDKHPIAQDETKRTMKRPEFPEKRKDKPLVQAKTKRGKKMTDGASNKGEKKVQNRETPQKKETEGAAKRLMKRATKRPANKGVLGTGDLSDGPFILDVPGKEQTKRKRPFVHAKRDEIERDEKQKKTGRSTVPSSSDILLVALTVASILALVGIAVLGRRATKTANNPYDYQPLSVSQ